MQPLAPLGHPLKPTLNWRNRRLARFDDRDARKWQGHLCSVVRTMFDRTCPPLPLGDEARWRSVVRHPIRQQVHLPASEILQPSQGATQEWLLRVPRFGLSGCPTARKLPELLELTLSPEQMEVHGCLNVLTSRSETRALGTLRNRLPDFPSALNLALQAKCQTLLRLDPSSTAGLQSEGAWQHKGTLRPSTPLLSD